MELKMALSLGCSASFILTMHHSLGSLLTGMEVPLEIREWKTGGLISGSQWQVGGSTFFKDLVDSGKVDLEIEIHNKCLWFCFSGVLESALNDMRKYWNTHYIRQSCHKTVAGVPDTLHFLPENRLWLDWLSHSLPTRGNWWYEVGMSGCRGWECTSGVFWIFNEDWGYPVSYYIWWGSHSVFIFNKSCRSLTFHLVNFNTAFSIAFSKH